MSAFLFWSVAAGAAIRPAVVLAAEPKLTRAVAAVVAVGDEGRTVVRMAAAATATATVTMTAAATAAAAVMTRMMTMRAAVTRARKSKAEADPRRRLVRSTMGQGRGCFLVGKRLVRLQRLKRPEPPDCEDKIHVV